MNRRNNGTKKTLRWQNLTFLSLPQIATMKKVSHPNCVHLHEVFDEPTKTYLILDL